MQMPLKTIAIDGGIIQKKIDLVLDTCVPKMPIAES